MILNRNKFRFLKLAPEFLLIKKEYFLKKFGKSICISKNSVYFSVLIEQINPFEISLSYLKSRWLTKSISFELYV